MFDATLRAHLLAIFHAGLRAANPVEAVERHLHLDGDHLVLGKLTLDLESVDRIFLLGMGKASAIMAKPVTERLGSRVAGGIINVKYGHRYPLSGVEVMEAAHPVPDEAGFRGVRRMIRILEETREDDLVICLISGGGSALAPAPVPGLSLEDKKDVTQRLLDCGATIHEMNSVRKHLSRIKGGRLARMAWPGSVVSLILSDVIGDDLDTIASGPTVPDPSTYYDCLKILSRYNLGESIPQRVVKHLERGARGEVPETPKEDDPAFRSTRNVIVGSNTLALEAAASRARELGYGTLILSSSMEGETRDVAGVHAAMAREVMETGNPLPRPACLISGGETTVTLRGSGKGGRNQEFALAAALEIQGFPGIAVLSGGTDGTDGPTDAAGALADGGTVERGREKGLDAETHLATNDSYPFFEALDDLLLTGPTLTNVMDLRVVLVR